MNGNIDEDEVIINEEQKIVPVDINLLYPPNLAYQDSIIKDMK